MIKILMGKSKHQRIRRIVPKLVWYLVLVWEEEIYSHKAVKYGITLMGRLTGGTVDISESTEF